jgi:hypothetical protein
MDKKEALKQIKAAFCLIRLKINKIYILIKWAILNNFKK